MNLESNAYGVLLAAIASTAWAVFVYFIKRALMNAPVLKVTAVMTSVNAALVTLIAVFFISFEDFWSVTATTLMFAFLGGLFPHRHIAHALLPRHPPHRAEPLHPHRAHLSRRHGGRGRRSCLGETPTLSIFTGLAILLIGITLIVQAEPSRETEAEARGARWKLFGWISAGVTSLLWGVAAIFFKKASLNLHPLATAAIALWVGAATTFAADGARQGRRGITRSHPRLGLEVDIRRSRLPDDRRSVL